jgi:hypothetical protein
MTVTRIRRAVAAAGLAVLGVAGGAGIAYADGSGHQHYPRPHCEADSFGLFGGGASNSFGGSGFFGGSPDSDRPDDADSQRRVTSHHQPPVRSSDSTCASGDGF